MGQIGLSEFSDETDGGDRPVEEARAVAGESEGPVADIVDPAQSRYPAARGTVAITVTQVDYTLVGSGGDERPIIHVFGRTAENTLEHVRVHGFRPYFYAPTGSIDGDELSEIDGVTGWSATDDEGRPYESIRGERLTKIYGRTPRDVGGIRDRFDHYEADILFPNRFMIDKGIRSGIRVPQRRRADGTIDVPHEEVEPTEASANVRVNTFDIEVDDRRGFPEDGEEPIICLSSHDSYRDEYIGWLFDAPDGELPPPEAVADHELIDEDAGLEVRTFETEEAMLEAFLDYVDGTDPDLMTGWNFVDFDAPYLIDRLKRLDPGTDRDLDYNRLSRVGEVWESDWQGPNIKGRIVFDLLYGYQRTQFSELDSYRLDAVAEMELGIGKERYPGSIGDLWEQDPERLLEYNLRDVELCVEINRKQDIIPFWREVATFVGCKLEDATTPGDAVDMYVLHNAHGKFALPSKGRQETEEFEGGAVFDPITGVKEMVSVLDLASLYPMAMSTMNASPETKVDPDTYGGETYVAPNGQHYRKEPDGIIREMIDQLLREREEKKTLRDANEPGSETYKVYDRQQQAVKVIMNCFTPDTEVLTPQGVRTITGLSEGDEVYSLDPDTMEMQIKSVTETHEYPNYRGELVDIETRDIDFRVTPNHRMLVRKNDRNGITEDDWRFVEADDLYEYCNYEFPHGWSVEHGEDIDRIDLTQLVDGEFEVWVRPSVHGHTFTAELGWTPRRVPKADVGQTGYVFTADEFEAHREYIEDVCESSFIHREPGRKWIPRTYDADDFLELIAGYITEGNVYASKEKWFGEQYRGPSTVVKIAQNEVPIADGGTSNHTTIGELLHRMGFDNYSDERACQFTGKLLGDYLAETCGGDSFEKRIPSFVFELSERQKRLFLETLIAGDGGRQTSSWRYTTSSKGLRDDILRLATHLGLNASYNRDSGSWRVYVTEGAKNTLRMYRSGGRSTAEDGVYCVSVADNNTLLAGRNGKFQFVGNSLYGVSGWERFRLYDKENAAAITSTGREVIKFTEEAADELDKEVIYGDTDSIMLELNEVFEGIDSDVPIPDEVRDTHPDMGDEELIAILTAIDVTFDIEEHINSRYDEFAREKLNAEFHRFRIEFEKLYRRFFQAGRKKRYAGHIVWKEGQHVDDIDITGFEYKRSDIAPITKRVQERVIEMIVRGADEAEIKAYVADVIDEFRAGDTDLDDIAIPAGIGKRLTEYETDTAHVRGAKYANLFLGTNFNRGSKPKRLYLERVDPAFFERFEEANPELFPNGDGMDGGGRLDAEARWRKELYNEFRTKQDVICFEYADQIPDEFTVDYDKMLDKTLRGPIARVLEALDISWEEVKTGQEQTGLESFM